MRQYNILKEKASNNNRKFTFRDMHPVILIILMKTSPSVFTNVSPNYIHRKETTHDSSAKVTELSKTILICGFACLGLIRYNAIQNVPKRKLKALQTGEASKVVPIDKRSVVLTLILAFIFLHEQFTWKSAVGSLLITLGTLFMVL